MSTASKVAQHKEAHPGMYCLKPRCLWRTDAPFCPRHQPKPEAPYKVQARQIANIYNTIAEQERRVDLED